MLSSNRWLPEISSLCYVDHQVYCVQCWSRLPELVSAPHDRHPWLFIIKDTILSTNNHTEWTTLQWFDRKLSCFRRSTNSDSSLIHVTHHSWNRHCFDRCFTTTFKLPYSPGLIKACFFFPICRKCCTYDRLMTIQRRFMIFLKPFHKVCPLGSYSPHHKALFSRRFLLLLIACLSQERISL